MSCAALFTEHLSYQYIEALQKNKKKNEQQHDYRGCSSISISSMNNRNDSLKFIFQLVASIVRIIDIDFKSHLHLHNKQCFSLAFLNH